MKNPSDDSAGKHDPTESWKNVPGYEHVNLLDDSAFFEFIKTKPRVLVMFYAPWCGHCTHMKPAYAEAAGDLKRFLPGSYLAAVDATKCKKVAKKFKTNGFPTLKYFENGEFKFDYTHGRKREDLVEFMKNPTEKVQEKTEL
jgi:protein disulfide-isomerase-like protein